MNRLGTLNHNHGLPFRRKRISSMLCAPHGGTQCLQGRPAYLGRVLVPGHEHQDLLLQVIAESVTIFFTILKWKGNTGVIPTMENQHPVWPTSHHCWLLSLLIFLMGQKEVIIIYVF